MAAFETRHLPFEVRNVDDADEGLTLEGYAAVFNDWTEIADTREGVFMERIAPGAFAKTLSERTPILQFDHGSHPLIGSIPLGVFRSIKEDEHGLLVRAKLSDNWLVAPVRDAIREGAITGMSFKFSVPRGKDSWDRTAVRSGGLAKRTINEVALFEAGPVVWPAYESTSVGVRAREFALDLADPQFRAELAHLLLATPDMQAASALDDGADDSTAQYVEPAVSHSRTRSQRRARVLLTLGAIPS
jgi:uncharacterized protein